MVKGLSYAEVEKSRRRYGTNAITARKKNSFFKKLLKNLTDPIIKVLIGALVITLLFGNSDGNIFESLGIAIAIAVSTLVSTLSEYGSEKAFRKMQNITELVIPSTVSFIGLEAFYNCNRLHNLTFEASPEVIGDEAFAVCAI